MKYIKATALVFGIIIFSLMSVKMIFELPIFKVKEKIVATELKSFRIEDMKKFDGTDKNLPIYLAYEGNVYDVTTGKEFYSPGGVYHFITGKDATVELNMAGGGIIKRKYIVIGKIVK